MSPAFATPRPPERRARRAVAAATAGRRGPARSTPPRAPGASAVTAVPVAASAALALITLAYYLALAPHVVADGDSAELTMVLATLGVAHPTGYPLYTLLGHAFVAALRGVGVGYAYAANAWGALGGGVAVLLFHRLALRLTPFGPRDSARRAFAIAALPTLGLALNPQWIAECMLVEVYTWHVAWLCGAVLLFTRDVQDLEDRSRPFPVATRMLVWGCVCGVGGAHHRTAVFYAAVLTAGLAWALVRSGRFRPWVPLLWLAAGIVPMLSYGFLLWRASHPGAASVWPGLAPTLRGVYEHVSGAIYNGFLGAWRPGPDVSADLAHDVYPFLWPGLIVLAALTVGRARAERRVLGAILAGSALQLVFVYHYGVADPVSYFLPPLAMSWLGVAPLAATVAARLRSRRAGAALGAIGAVAVGALAVFGTRGALERRSDVIRYDTAIRSMWQAVPDAPSIFLWASDSYYKVELYQRFEGNKPQVAVYNTAMLCQVRPEEAFRRRYGFDPLANNGPEHAREAIDPRFIPEHHVLLDDRFLGRVNETIADSAKVPVLMFNGSAMRLRRLN